MLKSLILAGASLVALTSAAAAASPPYRPMFAVQPGPRPEVVRPSALPIWNFTYTYSGTNYSDAFVGTNPTGGLSTTIPVYIIPIKLTWNKVNVRDPNKLDSTGVSPVGHTLASPIFKTGIDFVQGGTNIGNTQYIDAFQRANLWGVVSSHLGYHVKLGTPKVKPEQSLIIPLADGGLINAWGYTAVTADINWFDGKAQALLTKLKIPANSLPIFVTTDAYLTQNGQCCIGGYHSYNGVQAYSHFTYVDVNNAFSQDVSALSHETGEWLDDPFTNNNSPCGIYEVGDPLEGDAHFGDYTYTLGGFTYHLQDLVTPVYFGAPSSTSVNGWKTFQGTPLSVCQNGP